MPSVNLSTVGRAATKSEIESLRGGAARRSPCWVRPGRSSVRREASWTGSTCATVAWPRVQTEVELITTGQADRLTALVDGLEANLVAVVDRHGRRMAVLTIPTAPRCGGPSR